MEKSSLFDTKKLHLTLKNCGGISSYIKKGYETLMKLVLIF